MSTLALKKDLVRQQRSLPPHDADADVETFPATADGERARMVPLAEAAKDIDEHVVRELVEDHARLVVAQRAERVRRHRLSDARLAAG
mgnify:CR=1 FL=1